MSAPISNEFLSGSASLLRQLYDHYEEQRQQTEIICNDCRSLFLPWPRKIQKSVVSIEKPGSGAIGTPNQENELTNENETKEDAREKAELALLDGLLVKAQKARDVQAKLSESKPVRSYNKVSKPPKPQTSITSGKEASRPLTTVNNDNVKPMKDTSKSVKTSTSVQRHSYAQKVANSKTKYKPAHSVAPFKTDPNMHRKKLISRPRSADRSTANKAADRHSCSISKSTDELHGDSMNDVKDVIPNNRLPPIEYKAGKCPSHDENEQMSDKDSAVMKVNEVDKNVATEVDVKKQESHSRVAESDSQSREMTEQFLLSRDGSKLSLPGKFKKLLHTNWKMKERLTSVSLTLTVDKTDCAQKFFDKFERLHRSVIELENDYKSVSKLLDHTKLDSLSEETNAKDVLKAKIILADVLSRFYSMEEEYQLIQKGLKNVQSRNLLSNASTLSSPVEKYREESPDVDILPQVDKANQTCAQIQYKSLKKLTQFVLLKGQVDALQLEKHVCDKTSLEILDYLQKSNPEDSCFNETYRSSYAMLCSSGRHYPTMVKDTLSSEDSDD